MQALHAKDAQGRTALHIAAIRGVGRNLEWLMIRGSDVDARDNQGCTPLMLAAQYGQCTIIGELRAQTTSIWANFSSVASLNAAHERRAGHRLTSGL